MNEIINLAKEIGQFIAFIIVSLFFCKQYLNKYFKKTNIGKMLPRQNKLDLEILNKLEYVKEILNADRIHVYEFHNGEHYSDYRSAYKFSCTYEVFKAGNQPVQQRCINLPTNCMPQFIHRITEDDKFIYQAKVLTEKDMIYINTLLLSQANEIIGFNDARKIIDSIYYFVWYQGNFNSVKSLSDTENEIVDRLIEGVLHSPYHSLCSYCDSKGGVNKTEFIFLFEELTNYIYKDFNSNPYICKYYLSMPEETIHFHALDFLGEGEKRLDVFRGILERIQKEKEQYV